jgi:hypothetical protein
MMTAKSKIKILTLALVGLFFVGFGGETLRQASEEKSQTAGISDADIIAHYDAVDLAKRIQELDFPGYVGLRVNPETRAANIWLSQDQSPELLDVIKDSNGFTVTVSNSPHTAARLDIAIQKINRLVRSSKIPGGVVLSSSAKREDGSGLDLTIDKTSEVPDEKWVKNFSALLGIPVFVDPAKTDITLISARVNDSSPWRGGSLFSTSDSSGNTVYCSRGFGVVSKVTDIQYMLAARHCFQNRNQTLRNFKSQSTMGYWMPKSYYNSESNDVSLTIPSLGVVRDSVYYGNLTTSNAHQVNSVGINSVGLRVCTNGANSGLHCNIVIRKGPHQAYAGNKVYENVVTGSKDNNQITAARGDSGGPVVSPVNSSGTLQGFGIMHSLSVSGECADFGVQVNVGATQCGRQVYWIDLNSALSALHVELK